MSEDQIHPVILCGGSGTRLWPLSRKSMPKPFLPLVNDETLFQQAVRRVAEDPRFAPAMVVAGDAHKEIIEQQLGASPGARLIIEPKGRNTAPAIALAATLLSPDSVMLVCPSDHHIAYPEVFREAAIAAANLARDDRLVSFGIEPDRPETGYGYIERGEALDGGYGVTRFVEKPDLRLAKEYVSSGRFSWNGGIFAFRAGYMLEELETHRPQMAQLVREAVAKGREEGARFYPDPEAFGRIIGDSIDYAVMENAKRAAMVPANMGWSDIGNWAALAAALADKADENGNLARGAASDFTKSRNVFSMSDGPRVSVVGLEDVCVVVSGNEVLVTTHEKSQCVGKLPGATDQ